MELSPRKKAILSAVIKSYIETGTPVGSKILTGLLENAPSSATLRSEMSELCNLGYLSQPHTSAGRVPTSLGFNFYVNSLMPHGTLTDSEKLFIDNRFANMSCNPEDVPNFAGQVLSDLTGLPAITCLVAGKSASVSQVELVSVGFNSLLLLVITSDGRARNRIFKPASSLTEAEYEYFKNAVSKEIIGQTVDKITMPFIQSIIAKSGVYSLSLLPVFTALFEAVANIEDTSVTLIGENKLYGICDEQKANRILSLVKQRDSLITLLSDVKKVGVIFGDSTGLSELYSDTLIAGGFNNNLHKGVIGVIAPYRVPYNRIMPSVEYIASKLMEEN